ncbi:hypothetical protein WDU94_007104 [Cyamophila willieti]
MRRDANMTTGTTVEKKRKDFVGTNEEKTVTNMDDFDAVYQNTMICNLVVTGITRVYRNESILKVVEQIGHKLGIESPLQDVVEARRIRVRNEGSALIVITLRDKTTKSKWLAQYREKKLWTEKLFINEHITKRNLDLIRVARELARKHGWHYVWMRDGAVRIRRNETSKMYTVKNLQDLHNILYENKQDEQWSKPLQDLFQYARNVAKDNSWKYVWVRRGSVRMQKNESYKVESVDSLNTRECQENCQSSLGDVKKETGIIVKPAQYRIRREASIPNRDTVKMNRGLYPKEINRNILVSGFQPVELLILVSSLRANECHEYCQNSGGNGKDSVQTNVNTWNYYQHMDTVQTRAQDCSKIKTKEKTTEANMVTLTSKSQNRDSLIDNEGKLLPEGDVWNNAINEVNQRDRLKNIIISGTGIRRVYKNESILRSVEEIGYRLGIKHPLNDVIRAKRVYLPDKSKGCMVIQMKSTLLRDKWLIKYRAKKLWHENWYMNDHLTKTNMDLLLLSKVLAKQHNWMYVWTKACKIFIRRNQTSRIYNVNCPDHLYSILNIPKPKTQSKPNPKDPSPNFITTNNSAKLIKTDGLLTTSFGIVVAKHPLGDFPKSC